jgi:hypothetical protein
MALQSLLPAFTRLRVLRISFALPVLTACNTFVIPRVPLLTSLQVYDNDNTQIKFMIHSLRRLHVAGAFELFVTTDAAATDGAFADDRDTIFHDVDHYHRCRCC